jgi:hypothetical protein
MSGIIDEIERYLKRQVVEKPKITYIEIDTKENDLSFKKSWNKLSGQEKINRLMLYQRIMVGTYNLNSDAATSLHKLFLQNYEQMTDAIVEYDIATAKVINIKGLKKDPANDEFYLDNADDKPRAVQRIKIPIFTKGNRV